MHGCRKEVLTCVWCAVVAPGNWPPDQSNLDLWTCCAHGLRLSASGFVKGYLVPGHYDLSNLEKRYYYSSYCKFVTGTLDFTQFYPFLRLPRRRAHCQAIYFRMRTKLPLCQRGLGTPGPSSPFSRLVFPPPPLQISPPPRLSSSPSPDLAAAWHSRRRRRHLVSHEDEWRRRDGDARIFVALLSHWCGDDGRWHIEVPKIPKP
jgi:hypothetical protein